MPSPTLHRIHPARLASLLVKPPWWLVASTALAASLAGAGWLTCQRLPDPVDRHAIDAPVVPPLLRDHPGRAG